ncbi:ERV/ALR sulfhydryl oxidase domain-containing protein [Dioszegia hungarica]|uniref:Sulfhydryl oxidase n=1 Tax=Dioszegia hungarica TaxID=4972 RepID=A0AA38LTT6_9TREE|nr:ERV/ALR sulfhydryl oxidase domain-containing protein [Dioszegia hungarica]KAI9634978.1 ERV/ALR sulfhydryl oxidase domain-containing protein [Dioszegia hungarica]
MSPSIPFPTSNSAAGPSEPKRTTKETHPNLPPGLILDAEGKVCKVCNSWQDWAKVGKKKAAGGASGAAGAGGAGGSLAGMFASARQSPSPSTSSSTPPHPAVAVVDRTDCPPDTAALGRSTWTFLHTTAAYYPLSATPMHQSNMRSLLSSLSVLYPCGWCAEDFARDMKANPPDVSGREGLMRWLCERHNEVNGKLGKERFECTAEKLGERWKDGPKDGRCD